MVSSKDTIIQNVTDKLGTIPIELSITPTDIESCLRDTIRELRIGSVDSIEPDSEMELYVEIRTQWHCLGRVRNSTALYFKYNTGSDGHQVDKTQIPKMISTIMDDLNGRYKLWLRTSKNNTGAVWSMTKRESSTLAEG